MKPILNLPNKITIARMLLVPVILALLSYPSPLTCWLAALGFIVASLTDLVDGHIARAGNMVTSFGKFLDPLADKVLVTSVLILFVSLNWIPGWVAIVIICRDLIITGLRAIAMDEGIVMAADTFGKIKTVLQMLAIIPLLIHYPVFGLNPQPLGQFLLYTAVVLTVFSGINYLRTFYLQWKEKHSEPDNAPSGTDS